MIKLGIKIFPILYPHIPPPYAKNYKLSSRVNAIFKSSYITAQNNVPRYDGQYDRLVSPVTGQTQFLTGQILQHYRMQL